VHHRDDVADLHYLHRQLVVAGQDLVRVDEVLDKVVEAEGAAPDDVDIVGLVLCELAREPVEQDAYVLIDRGQRRAEVVAHVRDERLVYLADLLVGGDVGPHGQLLDLAPGVAHDSRDEAVALAVLEGGPPAGRAPGLGANLAGLGAVVEDVVARAAALTLAEDLLSRPVHPEYLVLRADDVGGVGQGREYAPHLVVGVLDDAVAPVDAPLLGAGVEGGDDARKRVLAHGLEHEVYGAARQALHGPLDVVGRQHDDDGLPGQPRLPELLDRDRGVGRQVLFVPEQYVGVEINGLLHALVVRAGAHELKAVSLERRLEPQHCFVVASEIGDAVNLHFISIREPSGTFH